MNRCTLLVVVLLLSLGFVDLVRAADRPNVIVILVDDMGWSDLSCYGSEIPTPNLDALAKGGLRFTQFYNTGRCCPTRASLQTGLYPHQAGVGHMTEDKGTPGYQGRLNDNCVTFGEVLKPAGYTTIMTGKWHVGQNFGVTPWGRGYDLSCNAAAGGFYFPDSPRTEVFVNGVKAGRRGGLLP
jgi:arylsulfatase